MNQMEKAVEHRHRINCIIKGGEIAVKLNLTIRKMRKRGIFMQNQDIKQEVKEAGLKLWQIAEKLGMNDGNLSRKLRKELSQEEKTHIRSIIAELRAGEKQCQE